jgi:2-oxoglutarate decarboxylase
MRGFDESEFGPNAWLVDELYRQYLADPDSVSEAWREYFEDYQPRTGNGQAAPVAPAPAQAPVPAPSPPPEPKT